MHIHSSDILPATISSTTHCTPSHRCHYRKKRLICDDITVYLKSFTHESAVSSWKTPTQEPKHVVLTSYLFPVDILSCKWQTTFTIQGRLWEVY
jgi:hypothetical protein